MLDIILKGRYFECPALERDSRPDLGRGRYEGYWK